MAALRRNTVAPRMAAGFILSLLLCAGAVAAARQTVLLWPSGAPGTSDRTAPETVRVTDQGEHVVSNVHAPSISVFLPSRDKATGTAVIVIPGGGHTELWMDHEGYRVAEFLADHGVAAYVLKYRLAHAPGSTYTVEGDALADVQRAIRVVRSRAAEWSLDPDQVGVMGFSAGGELAALAGMAAADGGVVNSGDPVERVSARPRFQALLYPAIPQRAMNLSPDTPPTFLLGGAADQPAISQGLADLYLALRRAGAHAELHIYDGVGHGFGIRPGNTGPVAAWPAQFLEWLGQQGLAKRRLHADTPQLRIHRPQRWDIDQPWLYSRGRWTSWRKP
jgi:acetyl esterase/lipase